MPSRQPVILIGMHRSGTSMVTRLLEQLGLFVGWRKQPDHEALFFLRLNQWLLSQCGAGWDHPEPIAELIAHRGARALVTDYLDLTLRSPRSISFLGGRYPFARMPHLPFAWGWKDPRSTFTLPIWLDLFPEAKVVHIYRHAVDVAQSLLRRQESFLATRRARYQRLRFTYWIRSKQVGFTDGLGCASLANGLALWESYAREGRSHVLARGELGLELKYEDFLADTARGLEQLGAFCGLEVTRARCEQLASAVRSDRAYAYRSKPELVQFAEGHQETLGAFGY
jgi:hypothetical protein